MIHLRNANVDTLFSLWIDTWNVSERDDTFLVPSWVLGTAPTCQSGVTFRMSVAPLLHCADDNAARPPSSATSQQLVAETETCRHYIWYIHHILYTTSSTSTIYTSYIIIQVHIYIVTTINSHSHTHLSNTRTVQIYHVIVLEWCELQLHHPSSVRGRRGRWI